MTDFNALADIANRMVAPGRGILAADEGTSSIQKRFDSIKVPCTEESRRDYREMLFSAKDAMKQYVSGVILFDETIRQKAKNGAALVSLIFDPLEQANLGHLANPAQRRGRRHA